MFLKTLVRAINNLASGLHDLASSGRVLAASIRGDEEALEKFKEPILVLEEKLAVEKEKESPSPTTISYYEETSEEREEELAMLEKYWESRQLAQSREEASLVVPVPPATPVEEPS